jgi:hypothetical protein
VPDLREIRYGYDQNGNLTSLTPPRRPSHEFGMPPEDGFAGSTHSHDGASA